MKNNPKSTRGNPLFRCTLSRRESAFTLIEICISVTVFALFLTGAYSLLFGGQRASEKTAWLQFTSGDLRKAEAAIAKIISQSSYPTTMTPSRLYDPGGTLASPSSNSLGYYVHFPMGARKIAATESIGLALMYLPNSQPERTGFSADNRPLTLTWNRLIMETSPSGNNLGQLVLEERTATITTTAPNYAASLIALPTTPPVSRKQFLVKDVDWIQFEIASASHKPNRITITINCVFAKDKRLFRQGISAALPNVGLAVP